MKLLSFIVVQLLEYTYIVNHPQLLEMVQSNNKYWYTW